MPNTHQVRVRIREVTYARLGKNILDQPEIQYVTAYGPARPEIDPATLLGQGLDPNSEEAQRAAEDFKKGQLISLLDEDYMRLKNGGAVLDAEEADALEAEPEDEILDVATASVDDLARWIEQEKPTINAVVQASGGEAEIAKKLLEAESQATDGDPRKGVLEGLTAVISRG
jgi:hypothetical protein